VSKKISSSTLKKETKSKKSNVAVSEVSSYVLPEPEKKPEKKRSRSKDKKKEQKKDKKEHKASKVAKPEVE
jgi:hypothetical protein